MLRLAFAIPAVLGLLLILRGWRGRRIDDHPLCRRCGYDLFASGQAVNCPECGRDVRARRAIRVGHRRRRWVMLALGALLTLVTMVGVAAWGVARAKEIDWTPHKPLWLLRMEARNSTASGVAIREIEARLEDGRLSNRQIDSIVDEAIAAQLDVSKTWHSWWGEFVERAATDGRVDDTRLRRYLINAVKPSISLETSAMVQAGEPVSVHIVLKPFRAGQYPNTFSLEIARTRIAIGGKDTLNSGRSLMAIDSNSTGRISKSFRVDLPPGRHLVKVDVRLRAGYAMDMARATEHHADGTLASGWELAEDFYTLAAEFEVTAGSTTAPTEEAVMP